MLLAFDIGNTETTVGLFAGDRLEAHWRLHSTPERTPDEWASVFTTHLTQAGHSTEEIRAAIVASVAPQVTQSLSEGVKLATRRDPTRVDGRSKLPMVLDVDEPLTVGRFIGAVIMPGMRTASDDLVRKTAKLPATELLPPTHAIGRRTEDCIRAGVLWGTADAVDGLVRRIKAEWPSKSRPLVVATGGLAGLIVPLCKEIESVHSDLTLIGLRIAAAALGLKW